MAKKQETKVVQAANAPEVPGEVIAQEIVKVARGMEALTNSRLAFPTVVLLVAHSAKAGHGVTRDVLLAARDLARTYLKPPEKAK